MASRRHAQVALVASVFVGCAPTPKVDCPRAAPLVSARPEPLALALLPGGEPVLRMPFPSGTVALCQQGNNTGSGHSHSYSNTLHALDLSTPGRDDTPIVAAADGKVVRVSLGSTAGVKMPGWGFGNHVVLQHDNGYFTLYGHMSSIRVKEGDEVKAGDALGVIGDTGFAGYPHVHFSLHHVDHFGPAGAPPTSIIHGLVTADTESGVVFGLRTSLELECADSAPTADGHLYASENTPGRSILFGLAPDDLRATAESERAVRLDAVSKLDVVGALLARIKVDGPSRTRDALRSVPDTDPNYAVAVYWVATISMRDLGDWDTARTELTKLETMKAEVAWIQAWVIVRKAWIAEHDGKPGEAKKLWTEAAKQEGQNAEFQDLVAQAKQKYGL